MKVLDGGQDGRSLGMWYSNSVDLTFVQRKRVLKSYQRVRVVYRICGSVLYHLKDTGEVKEGEGLERYDHTGSTKIEAPL